MQEYPKDQVYNGNRKANSTELFSISKFIKGEEQIQYGKRDSPKETLILKVIIKITTS